jgi:ATP-dependent DNA helicase RecQ
VLKGDQHVILRKQVEKKTAREGRDGQRKTAAAQLDADSQALFERLRIWRSATAKEHGVPAYVIFHDATLSEIARLSPQSADELRAVSGIGARKLESYGLALIEVCRSHADA